MRVIFALFVAILVFGKLENVANADMVADNQLLAAQTVRKNLPMKVDEYTTWLSATSAGRTLIYTYRMEISKNEIPASWYRDQRSLLKNNVCSEPTMRKLLFLGAKYSYLYMDIGGRHLTTVDVDKTDC